MSQENVKIVASLYEAFAKGDIPHALSVMDAGIEWREADNFVYADRNPYIGPDAVLNGVFAVLARTGTASMPLPKRLLMRATP